MTADPREPISDFTEITDEELVRWLGAFFRTVAWGTLAGGGLFLILTVPIGISMMVDRQFIAGLGLALMPLGLAGAGTLAGMLLVGLPLTALLRHMHCEEGTNYAAVGAVAGFILPCLLLAFTGPFDSGMLLGSLFLGMFGATAGGVAGNIWGAFRQSLYADDPEAPVEEGFSGQPANPFHDMIH